MLTLLFKGQGQILRFHVINFSLKRFLHLSSLVPSCSTLMSKFPFLSHPKELLASRKFWCKDRARDGGGSTTGLDPLLRTQFGVTLVQLPSSWSGLTLCVGLVPRHPLHLRPLRALFVAVHQITFMFWLLRCGSALF